MVITSFILLSLAVVPPSNPKYSTLTLLSPEGNDVSKQVEVNVWIPKNSIIFDEWKDTYSLLNFELLGPTQLAGAIQVDFSKYESIWIEIDPKNTSVYENEFHLLHGYSNKNHVLYIYQLPEGGI